MHYFIILTKECNLFCSYCGGGSDSPPREIQYSIEDLRSFLSKDRDPVIEFYGGEPLLRIKTMKSIMDSVPGRFVIRDKRYLPGQDRTGVSLKVPLNPRLHRRDGGGDGPGAGERVYERTTRNAALVREKGFRGDLVARMTVEQGTDIYENVQHLLGTGLFDHVHWQLSFSMFWEAGDQTVPGLPEWLDAYNSGITSLVDAWVGEMSRSHRVLGMVPFIAVMDSLLSGRRSSLRCGSGIDFFSVMPDGRISACPVSIDHDFSMVGSITESRASSLSGVAAMGEPCLSCDIYGVCGGRCLFVNRSQEMLRENGFPYICSTVRHLVKELQDALPEVQALIKDGSVKRSDFAYPELNNGCEIIP